jgi:sulfur carrier protein
MQLSINGQARDCAAGTIAELLQTEIEGAQTRGIAVAVNGEVVPRSRWNEAALTAGDRVEIVRALPGG